MGAFDAFGYPATGIQVLLVRVTKVVSKFSRTFSRNMRYEDLLVLAGRVFEPVDSVLIMDILNGLRPGDVFRSH